MESLAGSSHSGVVRIGETVRRAAHSRTPAIHDFLRHLEREGFAGAPRPLGFDDDGREVLTYIEGEGAWGVFIAARGGRFDRRLPDFVWNDDVLSHLGALIRRFHDAAA